MAIKGPDIQSSIYLDLTQFIQAARFAANKMTQTFLGMEKKSGQFATTMNRRGQEISGTWWKRFGTVALGFTIAYRAMNVFENGLMKLGATFKEAILQSGQLAEQQAKNAFWMTVFADKTISFADAFKKASGAINALRIESVRSISSIDELTTGIDELAQAGLPITERLMPQMVSLVDFTGMVAQTVGSTTRQIRQEMQALMDGTSRVTNQLVRVLTNMGILTRENLSDLKKMVNRAEIFEKVADAIHVRWLAMVDTLIRSSPERAFAYWEKSIQKVLVQAVLLASQMKGVENLFGETFFKGADKFRDSINADDTARLVYFIGKLNDGLVILVDLFNKSVTGIAALAMAAGGLAREFSTIWGYLGDLTVITLTIKGLQLLGKTIRWLVLSPFKLLGGVVGIVFAPLLLATAALGAVTVLVVGKITEHLGGLEQVWKDLKSAWKTTSEYIIDQLDSMEKGYKEFLVIADLGRASFYPIPPKEGPYVRMPIEGYVPEPSAVDKIKSFFTDLTGWLLEDISIQGESFRKGLDVLYGYIKPYWDKLRAFGEDLFEAPPVPDFTDIRDRIGVTFSSKLPPLVFADLKKMGREMEKFSDKTPAFINTLNDLKAGLLRPEDVAEVSKIEEITAAYTRMAEALSVQIDPDTISVDQWNEYFDLTNLIYNWREAALANNDATFFLKRYLEQLKALESVQDDYNNLVMTGSQYRLWSLDEELKDLRALAIGNDKLIRMIEKYANARRESIENEFNGLAKLADDVAQSMENSFSDLFFDVMTTSWDDLASVAENALRGMQRSLADFLSSAVMRKLIGEKMGGGGYSGGWLSDLFDDWFKGGGGGGVESGGFDPGGYYGQWHQGGVVGDSNIPKKQLPMSLLGNAVRLHNGLRSDEYPAILQRGETVYSKEESKAWGMSETLDISKLLNALKIATETNVLDMSKNLGLSKDWTYMHQGGIVGSSQAPTEPMPLSLLENAVRLHSGLRSDEYPAILQQGETVYAKGESPIEGVTIINNTGITPEVSETRKSGGGKDISIMIGEMAAKDVYKGGPLGQALKSTYGLQSQTIRR